MGCSPDNTVLLLIPQGTLQTLILDVASAINVQVCQVENATDLIALPSFLAIVDPQLLSGEAWDELCDGYRAMQDTGMKFLLIQPSPHGDKMPQFNVLKTPQNLDATYLKFLMLRTRASVARRMAAYRRPEKRIIRMMYMLCQLENAPPLRLQDVAREFEASVRTIQRDFNVLLMAGHPIIGPDENGGYRLPKNYKAYSIYPSGQKK